MKKAALVLVLLNLSFPTFAVLPKPSHSNISVPLFSEGFYVGGGLSFMQPTATDADLVFAVANTGNQLSSKPGFDWGWIAIDVGYIFPNSGNDITLDYWHFGSQDTTRGPAGVTNAVLPLTVTDEDDSIVNFAIQTRDIISKPEYDVNQVDLTVGQYIDIGFRLQVHPNVGLQFSRINQKLTIAATDILSGVDNDAGFFAIPVSVRSVIDSTFNGIGPRISFDADYALGHNFDFVGQIASAILVGDFTSKLSYMISEEGGAPLPIGGFLLIPPRTFENSFSTFLKPRVVPNLEGKLALNYTYWLDGDISHITFTAGYQIEEYFNSLDYMNTSGNLDRPDGVNLNFMPGPFTRHMADFGIHGPFIGVRAYF